MTNYIQCAACGHVQLHHKDNCTVENCTCRGFIDPGPGTQTCPRRMGEMGPWEYKENLDHWETSRWNPYYQSTWPEQFERPRTCSFCGGIHPDDAIKLIEAGWEVGTTGKSYKRYLEPPGTRERYQILLEQIKGDIEKAKSPEMVSPVPPVKLYTMHMSRQQIDRFNEIVLK